MKMAMPHRAPGQPQSRVLALLVATFLLAGLCAACKSGVPAPTTTPLPTPQPTAAQNTSAAAHSGETAYLTDAASVTLYLSGERIHTIKVEDEAGKLILNNAIFSHLISSAACPGDNPDTIQDRITITYPISPGNEYPSVFHVFDRDGRHCMQAGAGLYSAISDKVYGPLHELAMGYDLPQAMTVRSGKNEINATALPVEPDGERFAPQQMAGHIQYLELDPEHLKESFTPFTPYIGGKKVYGAYRLYNERFEEQKVIMPSGLEPQTPLFSGREPGRYIIVLETGVQEKDGDMSYQYFFGVIMPQGYQPEQ